ncbi:MULTISPECIES: DUF4157 domain-containing protein [Leptolyngbya]|uniref:eCIS core domain-containing protein n=1 Tax=Leptolyngbya TaxID=47251 RepID=UPI001684DE09|nr:DUF4157 domain-containing protein [Leptolyngbya sp. FACHB-1624]MBD1859846.1 DUF4157 domain-containing protein [Leptolyngbya sp. FACHB-1624]
MDKQFARKISSQTAPINSQLRTKPFVQPKLTIGEPNDQYEQEADRVAAQVVDQINTPVVQPQPLGQPQPSAQPQEAEEEELQTKLEITAIQRQEEEELQTSRETGEPQEASQALVSAIDSARGSGQSLDAGLQRSMGQAMGADFSRVKIHTDARADQMNRSIQAKAFTTGQDVFFRQGMYEPGTRSGQELIAHELTHVVQQNASSIHRSVIQRKVGFEFETSWRVRDISEVNNEEGLEQHQEEKDAWIAKIDKILLTQMLPNPVHALKVEGEKNKPQEELKELWFSKYNFPENPNDPNVLKEEGLNRITRLHDHPQYPTFFNELVQTLRTGNKIAAKPLLGKNIAKAAKIVTAAKYDLTADSSPAGGSNLEWVTAPLTSAAEVNAVMTNLTAMVHQFNGLKNQEEIKLDELGGIQGGGVKAKGGLVIYPEVGKEMIFEPQTTTGIKIDQLPKLLEYLNDQTEHWYEWESTFLKRKQAKSDLFGQGGLDKLVAADASAKVAIAQFKQTVLPQHAPQLVRTSTKELEGLAILLASYLKTADTLPAKSNAKSIAEGLMSRTDFAHNFKLLPPAYQQFFSENPQQFVNLMLDAAEMKGTGGNKVYTNTVERGGVDNRVEKVIPLTRQQWLENIPSGVDLLKHYSNLSNEAKEIEGVSEDDWNPIHKSLGALGSVDDQVGAPGKQTDALVVEFRRMFGGNMTEADLLPTAKAIYALVDQLNKNENLKYEKQAPN